MWKLRAVSCVCLLSALSAQGLEVKGLEIKTAKMATADTAVTVEAGADAPRLLQLSGPDGFVWAGQKPDELIDFVEAGGQRQTVHWRLNLAACQIGPRRWVRLRFEVSAAASDLGLARPGITRSGGTLSAD